VLQIFNAIHLCQYEDLFSTWQILKFLFYRSWECLAAADLTLRPRWQSQIDWLDWLTVHWVFLTVCQKSSLIWSL